MKNLIWTFLLSIPFLLQAQDAPKYTMFTTVYLAPDFPQLDKLREGLKAHNEKYHTEGSHEATVYMVNNGPRSGDYVWVMGPHTFADMDKDLGEDHGPHWGQNVSPYITDEGPAEFWRLQEPFVRQGPSGQPILRVRFLEVNIAERQGYRMDGLFQQIAETVKEMEGDFGWAIYENEFQQGKLGRHFAVVTNYANWAELDKDRKFREIFEKKHGEGSFEKFQREMGEVFSDTFDEYWTRVKF